MKEANGGALVRMSLPTLPVTWLIVEDDRAILDALTSLLGLWNCPVVGFTNGQQALDYLNNDPLLEPLPNIGLIDISLPDVPGDVVSAAVRDHPALAHAAIVLMTAFRLSQPDEELMLQRSRADHVVYKPLPSVESLLALADDLLRRRAAQQT
jgi:DNA-binding response OmpR family regulator